MMRTVREANEDLEKSQQIRRDRQSVRADLWKKYLQRIEGMDIPIYHPIETNYRGDLIDKTNYEEIRNRFRDRIASVKHADRGFIDIVCDECETMLFDNMVGSLNMSNPPSFWADCIGCGKRYSLDASLRCYADPNVEC